MEQARRDDVIVAYEMEGAGVSREHGGPVRLYVAPMYGYKSCKWLEGIVVVDEVRPGYWEQLGYDVDGWVGKSNGRDDPADVSAVTASTRASRGSTAPSAIVHWCNATLFLVLIATGAALLRRPAVDARRPARARAQRSTSTPACCCRSRSSSGSCLPFGRQLRADLGRLSRWDRRRPRVVAALEARGRRSSASSTPVRS